MTIAVSAPGKVLLAGGYLVLDKNYSGLVFGLSARIHCISTPDPSASKPGTITVKSPQFKNAIWIYEPDRKLTVKQVLEEGSTKNPFVETTLRYVLSYISTLTNSKTPPSTTITILADNDYYSQHHASAPRFNNLSVPLSTAHKTGLGSSAALVTSLTGCLLTTFSPPPPSAPDMRTIEKQQLIHNLSQASHCAAQGKVGSGFDVAAAVFGSCVYRRFSPGILEEIPDSSFGGFARRLKEVVEGPWDLQVSKTRVPPGIRVVMGDVDCGSSTPGLVKTVLAWRKENPEDAKLVWDALEGLNRGLIDMLEELRICAEEDAVGYEDALTAVRVRGWKEAGREGASRSASMLKKIGEQVARIRMVIRTMGQAAGVPIEPDEQTRLLDAIEGKVKGVLGGVVPGAGGYDAVAFLLIDHEDTLAELNEALASWEGGKVKALETREEQEGVRREPLEGYKGLGFF